MSGPIVRKYGFPNFEKIFGERELQHGVEDSAEAPESSKKEPAPLPVERAAKEKAPKTGRSD